MNALKPKLRAATVLGIAAALLASVMPAGEANQRNVVTGYGQVKSRNTADFAGGYTFCQGLTAGVLCGGTRLKPTRLVRLAAKTPERYVRVTGTISNGVMVVQSIRERKKSEEILGSILRYNATPPCVVYDPAYRRLSPKPSVVGPLTMTSTTDSQTVLSSGDPTVTADCHYTPGTVQQERALLTSIAEALGNRLVIVFTDPSRITIVQVTYIDSDLVQRIRDIAGDLPVSIVPWIE